MHQKIIPSGTFLRISTIICLFIWFAVMPRVSGANTDVRGSMVKIYSIQNEPDYNNPWNMKGPESSSGSGCVISENRILTNAHVVSDQTYLQVRLHGQPAKHPAKVIAVSHDADLALITVADPSFFRGVKPLAFGQLPELEQEAVVYGFPEGGDSLSTTKGVISRIEHQRYAHSLVALLAGQLDAAINAGNSGGPVMVEDKIVGVVMQTRKKSENIGYMVPVPVVDHFLTDVADGRYDGIPEDGVIVQSMENASLKKMHGLNENQTGALVIAVAPGSSAEGQILPGDVILAIDGHPVADDATVEFRPKERTHCDYYIQKHQIGEHVSYTILRQGTPKTVEFALNDNCGSSRLIPKYRYDVQPTYFVYGGLVFSPITLNYIMTWGHNWTQAAPFNLVNYYLYGQPVHDDEEVVSIIKVLPFTSNNSYDNFTNDRIVEANGVQIRNLRHLISIVEAESHSPFIVFKTESGYRLALDRQTVDKRQTEILDRYKIKADRSLDLVSASIEDEYDKGKMARAAQAFVERNHF